LGTISAVKWRIIQLGVFLLVGAVVNVAVAWGCLNAGMYAAPRWVSESRAQVLLDSFGVARPEHISVSTEGQAAGSWTAIIAYGPRTEVGTYVELRRSGWPTWSFQSMRTPPLFRISSEELLHPIWPGFAINTVFYAAICWLLFAAPFAVRRRRRIKRGLCQSCAYPVGTSDVCTECGRPIQPRIA
jgi:hypothetical protein